MNESQVFSPQDCCNNNGSPASSKSRIPQLKTSKASEIPPSPTRSMHESLSRTSSREDIRTSHMERWKMKYQESDRKFKALLVKSEKTLREKNDFERKFQALMERNIQIENQLVEKDSKLSKLRAVSEKVYKEYDQLKNQYEVETQAMHKAMQSAGQWYQQNRRLKRRSAALLQRLPPQTIEEWDALDAVDTASESSAGEELEGLRETVTGLSKEVATLQTEIGSLKLQEFEATELNVNLTQELEYERELNIRLERRLQEILDENDRNKRLARHLAMEVAAFREQLEQYKNEANEMKCVAETARKERDVMADRSSVYLEAWSDFKGFTQDNIVMMQNNEFLLNELEKLRTQIEEERIKHTKEIDDLQGKILDRDTSDEIFILEEKLNLAEEDVKKAVERAEKAEKTIQQYENKRKSMVSKIVIFEPDQKRNFNNSENQVEDTIRPRSALEESTELTSLPPPPPPLPPPPPPPPIPVVCDSDGKTTSSAIADMANMLGIKQNTSSKTKPSGGAIDEIVNQIKGGRFQLKTTEQREKKPKEEPAALKELLNILGTLKRRPKSQRDVNKDIIKS